MTFTEELLYPYHIFPEGVVETGERERGSKMEELFYYYYFHYLPTTYYYYPPASSISKVGRRRRNKEALKARNWTVIEKKFQKALKESTRYQLCKRKIEKPMLFKT